MRFRKAIFTSVLMLLSGCSALSHGPGPAQYQLQLASSLAVAPGEVRSRIQFGEKLGSRRANSYYPYCDIERQEKVREGQGALVIPPQTLVGGVIQHIEHPQTGLNFSYLGDVDGPTYFEYTMHMRLHDVEKTGLRALNCYKSGDYYDVQTYTLEEINQVLGHVATLRRIASP